MDEELSLRGGSSSEGGGALDNVEWATFGTALGVASPVRGSPAVGDATSGGGETSSVTLNNVSNVSDVSNVLNLGARRVSESTAHGVDVARELESTRVRLAAAEERARAERAADELRRQTSTGGVLVDDHPRSFEVVVTGAAAGEGDGEGDADTPMSERHARFFTPAASTDPTPSTTPRGADPSRRRSFASSSKKPASERDGATPGRAKRRRRRRRSPTSWTPRSGRRLYDADQADDAIARLRRRWTIAPGSSAAAGRAQADGRQDGFAKVGEGRGRVRRRLPLREERSAAVAHRPGGDIQGGVFDAKTSPSRGRFARGASGCRRKRSSGPRRRRTTPPRRKPRRSCARPTTSSGWRRSRTRSRSSGRSWRRRRRAPRRPRRKAETAEAKAATAEKWAAEAESKAFDAVSKAKDAEKGASTAATAAAAADSEAVKAAETRAAEAESRALESLAKAADAEAEAAEAEAQKADAEERVVALERRMDAVREEANAVEVAAAKVVAEARRTPRTPALLGKRAPPRRRRRRRARRRFASWRRGSPRRLANQRRRRRSRPIGLASWRRGSRRLPASRRRRRRSCPIRAR